MSENRSEQIFELFHEASELPEGERAAFLKSACSDEGTRKEVLAMLEADARTDSPLDCDAGEFADRLFGELSVDSFPDGAFASYRLIEKIGEGGMGVVFLAERDDLHSRVAIKVLPFARFSTILRDRFLREQRTLAKLNHRFIARLYDAGILPDGTPWFAMEHVDGTRITDYCKGRPIEERLALFRSACEAVQYLHRNLIIHRDIKPSNILITSDGTPKLLDFGIAKQMSALDEADEPTQTVWWMMSLAYAAPEQFGGVADPRTDVYSLGITLYEVLAGQYPFNISNRSAAEVERVIKETEPAKPSEAARLQSEPDEARRAPRVGSWAELNVLCLKAMQKDRGQRYSSVEALIRDVDHFLRCEPLEARPVPFRYKLTKFVRRNRAAVAAAGVVLALVVGLVTFFTVRLAVARNEAVAEAARKERIQRFMLSLFAGGDPQAGPSQDLRVVDIIDRGAQEAQTLSEAPGVQADLYQTLGTSYQSLGFFDRADAQLSAALERRKALYGPDHPAVAESLVSLGLLRIDQARMEDAERLIREGIEKTRRLEPPDERATAVALTALGKLLNARGSHGEAIRVLEECVRLHPAAAPATPEFAAGLSELADANFYAGNYDASDELNRRLLSLNRGLYGERHIMVANNLMNLAVVKFQQGHYKEAEELYNQSLDITRAWYRSDHPDVAYKLVLLGQAVIAQERFDEGERLLAQALDINERAFSKVHPRVASVLNELGVLSLRRGRLNEAEARFLRAADIQRAVYGDDNFRTITSVSNLATVYARRNDYPRAESVMRDVLARYTKISPDHLNTGIAHLKLGIALMKQRRYEEAEQHSLAGYEIASKQKSESWLKVARQDLVELYDAMKEPQKAARFRAELEKQ